MARMNVDRRARGGRLGSLCGAITALVSGAAEAGGLPPAGFKVAFLGDQGLGADSVAVLQLALDEGADVIVHLGDFDYNDDPVAWLAQIQDVLSPCFPYFAVAGNHDQDQFPAYQDAIAGLLDCAGVKWHGEAGMQYSFTYQGVYFVLTTPGMLGGGDAAYVADRLATPAAQAAVWRISGWHVLMRNMQIGGKSDESGWDVYENSRLGGAIIATAHEHSYERTNLLSDMSSQTVVGEDLVISEGETFAFVTGIGGSSIRDQERCVPTTWPYGCNGTWASIYASQQGATHGALFIEFNVEGNPRLARGYFKDIDGIVPDEFLVLSAVGPSASCPADLDGDQLVGITDLLSLMSHWGTDPGGPPDFNGNLNVGIDDLLELLASWGSCPSSRPCVWDLDGNQLVGINELLSLMSFWGADPGGPPDFNGDGIVGIDDLLDLLANWGPCPGLGPCGDATAGGCFVPHDARGCGNVECCNSVCAINPACCDTAWEQPCADLALTTCGHCGDPGAGDCCAANGSVGCDDAACCATVCVADPFCCEVDWDRLCGADAIDVCAICQ